MIHHGVLDSKVTLYLATGLLYIDMKETIVSEKEIEPVLVPLVYFPKCKFVLFFCDYVSNTNLAMGNSWEPVNVSW